jgi:hypothetical protein
MIYLKFMCNTSAFFLDPCNIKCIIGIQQEFILNNLKSSASIGCATSYSCNSTSYDNGITSVSCKRVLPSLIATFLMHIASTANSIVLNKKKTSETVKLYICKRYPFMSSDAFYMIILYAYVYLICTINPCNSCFCRKSRSWC